MTNNSCPFGTNHILLFWGIERTMTGQRVKALQLSSDLIVSDSLSLSPSSAVADLNRAIVRTLSVREFPPPKKWLL